MTDVFKPITATLRSGSGKGSARKLRKAGRLPAVIYAGGQAATSVSVEPKVITKALFGPLRRNQPIAMKLVDEKGNEAETRRVMVRDIQIDPIRRHAVHMDFVEIAEDKPVLVTVPVELVGKSQAVVQGGKLYHTRRALKITCLPAQIPEKLTLDVTDLGFGSHHAESVPLSEGATLVDDAKVTVLRVSVPRGVKGDDEAAAAAEGGAAAEG
jgi:large subunit ribosomal protein L25